MIVEFRDQDEGIGTKNNVNIDPSAEVVSIRKNLKPLYAQGASEFLPNCADSADDQKDHKMLHNANAYAFWDFYGQADATF